MSAAIGKSMFASGYQLLAIVTVAEIIFPLLITNNLTSSDCFSKCIPATRGNKLIVR